jgi:hypothetical protein
MSIRYTGLALSLAVMHYNSNMQSPKQTLIDILVVVVIPVVLVFGYFFVWKQAPTEDANFAPGKELEARGAKVREALNIIHNINFDGSMFTDQLFLALEDQTVPVASETIGRTNPFIPPENIRTKPTTSTPAPTPVKTTPVNNSQRLEQLR